MFQREVKGSSNPEVDLLGGMQFHSSWAGGTALESRSSRKEPVFILETHRTPNLGSAFAVVILCAVQL